MPNTTTRRPPFRRRGQNFLPLGPHVSLRADVTGSGGIVLGSTSAISFEHHQVASDIVVEVDWDNDGDFDEPEEQMTPYVLQGSCKTGRDWPSQLTGKAGPGDARFRLNNADDRFSYFNAASPLNTAPFSLKTGRKARVRVAEANSPDPILYARDRFRRAAGSLGSTEEGLAWTNQLGATWVISDQQAYLALEIDSSGAVVSSKAIATVNCGQTDYYAQITIPQRDSTNQTAIVYRLDSPTSYGAVVWQNEPWNHAVEVAHGTVSGGIFTETFSSGIIEHKSNTTIGVLVSGSVASIYVNGVKMASGAAYSSASTLVGIYGDWNSQRINTIDDFCVWSGLPTEVEGILWTGDISDLITSVVPGPEKYAELKGEGWLAKLAATDINPPSSLGADNNDFVGQTTGHLVGRTLALAGQLHPPGPIQAGEITCGSVGLPKGKALDIARQFEEVEFGFLYEMQEGPIGFDSRTARDASYPLVVFSDAPGVQFAYEAITPFDWRREVINQVAAGVSARPPTFPFIATSAISNPGGSPTDVTITMPTVAQGAAVGDLFLVIIAPTMDHPANGQTWHTPPGWTSYEMGGNLGLLRIYAKKATRSDLGFSYEFFSDASTFGGAYSYSIVVAREWWGDVASGVAVATSGSFHGSSGDEDEGRNDPPVIFPPWGKETSFFLAALGGMVSANGAMVSISEGPNGYLVSASSLNNGSVNAYDTTLQRAWKWDNVDIENPSQFEGTFKGFVYISNATIAVRGFNGDPPPVGSSRVVEVNDFDSQDEHNAVRSHRNAADLFRSEADAYYYGDLVLARYADDRPIFSLSFTATKSGSYRNQAIRRRVSDRITLEADNQAGLGVEDDFHIESIAHEFSNGVTLWRTTWELSPAVGVNRADTAGSELGAGIGTTDTVIQIDTITGPAWISSFVEPNMFPVSVKIGAEVIRLLSNTADPDNVSPQFYNVERSVNGVTESHDAGAAVSLAYPWILP